MADFDFSPWAVSDDLPRHTPGIHVRIGMVSTLDGFISRSGSSRGIGGEADLLALKALRAESDCVLNTAATVAREQLRPASTRWHVLLTTGNSLHTDLPIFGPGVERVVIVAGSETAPGDLTAWQQAGARVLQVESRLVDVHWLIPWLRDSLSIEKVVCEGGPMLNAHLSDAGLVDEWCLTIATRLLAGEEARASGFNRISNPLETGRSLYLRQLLALQTELIGIYSTHELGEELPCLWP